MHPLAALSSFRKLAAAGNQQREAYSSSLSSMGISGLCPLPGVGDMGVHPRQDRGGEEVGLMSCWGVVVPLAYSTFLAELAGHSAPPLS